MALANALICAARSLWYKHEWFRLRWERFGAPLLNTELWEYHGRRFFRNPPKVSVYIPTHNRVDLLLSRALPSVMSQDYKNFEVIVVAHGCTDDTAMKVIEAYPMTTGKSVWDCNIPRKQTYPPTAENHWLAGPVVPANHALKLCSGEFIARIDDDDVWTADHLTQLVGHAIETDAEFVSAAHETSEGKVEPYDVMGNKVGGTQTWLYRSYLRFFRYNPDCWRKKWNRVNDTDLQDRMARAGVRMAYLDRVVAKVYPRPGESSIGLKAYLDDPEKTKRLFSC